MRMIATESGSILGDEVYTASVAFCIYSLLLVSMTFAAFVVSFPHDKVFRTYIFQELLQVVMTYGSFLLTLTWMMDYLDYEKWIHGQVTWKWTRNTFIGFLLLALVPFLVSLVFRIREYTPGELALHIAFFTELMGVNLAVLMGVASAFIWQPSLIRTAAVCTSVAYGGILFGLMFFVNFIPPGMEIAIPFGTAWCLFCYTLFKRDQWMEMSDMFVPEDVEDASAYRKLEEEC